MLSYTTMDDDRTNNNAIANIINGLTEEDHENLCRVSGQHRKRIGLNGIRYDHLFFFDGSRLSLEDMINRHMHEADPIAAITANQRNDHIEFELNNIHSEGLDIRGLRGFRVGNQGDLTLGEALRATGQDNNPCAFLSVLQGLDALDDQHNTRNTTPNTAPNRDNNNETSDNNTETNNESDSVPSLRHNDNSSDSDIASSGETM